MQRLIHQQERNACATLKKNAEWKFLNLENSIFFFNLSKIYSAELFLIFPVVTGLIFKIDAINGKFVAMQQDSATLIEDLNAMKGTVESHLKK